MIEIPLQYIKTNEVIGHLAYRRRPLLMKQSRLIGRHVLVPEINLAAYKTWAVIDFIDLRLLLGRKSQFHHIKAIVDGIVGRSCYVFPHDGGNGGETCKFDVRVQDPEVEGLFGLAQAINERYRLELDPAIATLEVSIDFYPRHPDKVARARMLKTLMNSFMPTRDVFSDPLERPRFTFGRRPEETKFPMFCKGDLTERGLRHFEMSTEEDLAPYMDASFYVGARNSDSAWRIYDKILDRQNPDTGERHELPEDDRRARIEVTLQRPELAAIGLTCLHELKQFSFTSLQGRYFNFMQPTLHEEGPGVKGAMQKWQDGRRVEKFAKTGVIGLRHMDEAQEDHRTQLRHREMENMHQVGLRLPSKNRTGHGVGGTMVSYDEMNRVVSKALEHLDRRVATAFVRVERRNGQRWSVG